MRIQYSRCDSCGAVIQWARTRGNRRIPLDARLYADGNILLSDGVALVVPVEARSDYPMLRKSHFATCPNAAAHRRRKDNTG